MLTPDDDTLSYSSLELCERIAKLTKSMMDFWENGGWARPDARELLIKSNLHWQSSLAKSLTRWINADTEGDLILAWANLGALVEGQLMLFLCVHYPAYQADANAILDDKKKRQKSPDECKLEALRTFFKKSIWTIGTNWDPYVERVQHRRNAIHAFRHREIGSFDDWHEALRLHLSFVRDTGGRLPYPDEDFHGLWEI